MPIWDELQAFENLPPEDKLEHVDDEIKHSSKKTGDLPGFSRNRDGQVIDVKREQDAAALALDCWLHAVQKRSRSAVAAKPKPAMLPQTAWMSLEKIPSMNTERRNLYAANERRRSTRQ